MTGAGTETGWDYVPQNFEELQAWVREYSDMEAVAAEVIRLDDARALEKRLRKEVAMLRERLTHTSSILRWIVLELLSSGQISDPRTDSQDEAVDETKRKMLVEWLGDPVFRIGLGLQLGAGGNGQPESSTDCTLDCNKRVAQCRAVCCRRRIPLSIEELKENALRWSVNAPFLLSVGADGYCVHLDREKHQCTVYEDRPKACRTYTCQHDRQIWEDFEARKVHPGLKRMLAEPLAASLASVESK